MLSDVHIILLLYVQHLIYDEFLSLLAEFQFKVLKVLMIVLLFRVFLLLNTFHLTLYLANLSNIILIIPFEILELPILWVLSKSSMLTSTSRLSWISWKGSLSMSSFISSFTRYINSQFHGKYCSCLSNFFSKFFVSWAISEIRSFNFFISWSFSFLCFSSSRNFSH